MQCNDQTNRFRDASEPMEVVAATYTDRQKMEQGNLTVYTVLTAQIKVICKTHCWHAIAREPSCPDLAVVQSQYKLSIIRFCQEGSDIVLALEAHQKPQRNATVPIENWRTLVTLMSIDFGCDIGSEVCVHQIIHDSLLLLLSLSPSLSLSPGTASVNLSHLRMFMPGTFGTCRKPFNHLTACCITHTT